MKVPIGYQINRWTVVSSLRKEGKYAVYDCLCSCGNKRTLNASNLLRGKSKSCGCGYKKDYKFWAKLFNVRKNMIRRCYDTRETSYKYYGGRGVTVCEEWQASAMVFYDWAISNGFEPNLTLDRIDPCGPYAPFNCKWSTMTEQNNNKRNSVRIDGKTVSEIANLLGISTVSVYLRIKNNVDIYKQPRKKNKPTLYATEEMR